MRYKTIEVEKYKATYKVFDKSKQSVCFQSDDLYDAVVFCSTNTTVKRWDVSTISYTLKKEADYSVTNYLGSYMGYGIPRKYEILYYPRSKYVILTDLGDVVSEEEVRAARYASHGQSYGRWGPEWDERCYQRDSRLVCGRGSPKKIKQTYRKFYKGFGRWGHDFSRVIWSYYRHPRTHGEIKQACAHADEYGEQIVRAKRRYNNVPDAWDEYCSDVYRTEKSWKHNSKRRKQWVPK